MTMLDAWPFDQGVGANSGQTRWQKIGRVWAGNGVVPMAVTGLSGELAATYSSSAGGTITVAPGAVHILGTYGELAAQTVVNATGDGLLVARLDSVNYQILIAFNLGATAPVQTASAWELPLGMLSSGVYYDMRTAARPDLPVGSMIEFAGSTAPLGYLLCDGTSYLRRAYAALFTVIGTAWGTADASHFNVPDFRGRVPVGAGSGPGLSGRPLAQVGGEESHTLSSAENGYHNHAGNTGTESAWHIHGSINAPSAGGNGPYGLNGASSTGNTAVNIAQRAAFLGDFQTGNQNALHVHGIPVEGGNPHNNMQPFVAVTKIIKI